MASLLQKSTSRKEVDAAPCIMLTDESDEGDSPVPLTHKVERWKCDICCIQTFPTREECVSHEEICKADRETNKKEPEKKLHPMFQPAKRKPPPPAEQKRPKKPKANNNKATKGQHKVIVIDDTSTSETLNNHAIAPIFSQNTSQIKSTTGSNDLQELAAALGISPETLLAEQKALERQADRMKQQSSAKPTLPDSSLSQWKSQFSYGAKAKKQNASKTVQSKKTSHELNVFATALGVDPASLLAEQKAVEHQANRRKDEPGRNDPVISSTTPAVLHDSLKRRKGSAPLFPCPNHVSKDDAILSSAREGWLTSDRLHNMTTRWTAQSTDERLQNEDYKPIPLLNGTANSWEPKNDTLEKKLFDLLSKNLQVTLKRNPSTDVWVDRFHMKNLPEDLCGNRHQLFEIESFLKEWKEARQKCLLHMASKYIKTKKQKVKKYKDDDDDWTDSDTEEDFGLPSLCVVSGPVGCGKSDLIRAVVEAHDCRLLEVNTTEKRGAAALKRAIGEATQSLTSSELMRNSKKNSIFGISTVENTEQDTGSSLTAILLDEVDILFDNNGDAGFWQALHDLSKKSKSPIFLTANNIIEPPSFYCEYVQMERPRPEECTAHLRRCIRESAAFHFASHSEAEQDEFLEEFVRLCGCDIRKVVHELQAYSHSNSQGSHVLDLSMDDDDAVSVVATPISCNKHDLTLEPSVSSVHPSRVDADQYNLLEITGNNFLTFAVTSPELESDDKRRIPVTVSVGDQQCPVARILNDNTIMAVCPPRAPKGRECRRSVFYEPVQICSIQRSGITSTSLGHFSLRTLQDGSTLMAEQVPVNVEHYRVTSSTSGVSRAKEQESCGNESDEEFEFQDEDMLYTVKEVVSGHTRLSDEEAFKMLNDGIDAWLTRYPKGLDHNNHTANMMLAKDGIEELTQLCADTELASDAAFLEDVGLDGLPYPAGSALGFGYNLTEAYPLCSNETSKRPSESTLFQTGWKDDCGFYGSPDAFMTRPFTRIERRLLSNTEKLERGLALPEHAMKNDDAENSENDVSPTLRVDSEDAYLPNPSPLSLVSLPYDLRRARSNAAEDTYVTLGSREDRFEKAKAHRESVLKTLHSTIFVEEIDPARLFLAGLHRTLHALVPESLQIDTRLYLDYLPFLRCLAVFDRASLLAFQTGIIIKTEVAKPSSKKRATRQTASKGFSHLWETIVPPGVWGEKDDDGNNLKAMELTSTLADLAMYIISGIPKESYAKLYR